MWKRQKQQATDNFKIDPVRSAPRESDAYPVVKRARRFFKRKNLLATGMPTERRGPGLLDPGNFDQFGDWVENPGLQGGKLFLGIRLIFRIGQDQGRTP